MNKNKIRYLLLIILTFCFTEGYCLPFYHPEKDNTKISVVVIDPGHGGKDSGAKIGNTQEKDIVLNIALKLGEQIKNSNPGIKVIYTRTRDVFIPLHQRADIANKNAADLFISIHVNAVDSKSVQGTETFVLGLHRNEDNLEVAKKENAVILLEDDYSTTYEGFDPNLPESYIMFETMQEEYQGQSVMLASNIQNEFREHARRIDRSVKMAGFLVLRRTTMPSVLIETGFISHASERSFLLSDDGQTKLATSIFRAFCSYKDEIEEKSKFYMVTEDVSPMTNETEIKSLPGESKQRLADKETVQSTSFSSSQPAGIAKPEPDLYFTVQIMALKKKLNTSPNNFKGEKNIFRQEASNLNRYFSGKFNSLEEANMERDRIRKKYKNAFVVAFQDDKLISVKKAMESSR